MNGKAGENSPWILATERHRFQQDVFERSRQQPVVVDFWAPWCQPCRMLAPILEQLAVEYDGRFLLVKANTDELPEAAAQFAVQSIPAVYGVRDGEVRDFFLGLLPEAQIRSWLDRLLPSEAQLLSQEAARIAKADPAAAEAKFRDAMQLEPNLASPRIGLAELLLEQERLAECQEVLHELEERGFLEPEAQRVKSALELRRQGDRAGDVDACRKALERNPDDLRLQLTLAKALAAAKHYEEALELGLSIVQADRHGAGEEARKLMVDVFRLLPDESDLASTYRRKLSALLY